MISVFRIKNNVNIYQYFLTEIEEEARLLRTNGLSREHSWVPPSVFVYKPQLEIGNFFNFNSDALIADQKATEVLRSFFMESGELLPLPYKGINYTLLNVTECINCLDHDETRWTYDTENKIPLIINKYVFYKNRFPESCIFKIPETAKSELFVVNGLRDTEDEFITKVVESGLKGLYFEKVWEGV
jgi:hypothetical protein